MPSRAYIAESLKLFRHTGCNLQEFFQQRPDEIGMDGEDLMSKPAGRKLVRGLIKDKLHSLRNVTKDRVSKHMYTSSRRRTSPIPPQTALSFIPHDLLYSWRSQSGCLDSPPGTCSRRPSSCTETRALK